jgi:hypothetical protein
VWAAPEEASGEASRTTASTTRALAVTEVIVAELLLSVVALLALTVGQMIARWASEVAPVDGSAATTAAATSASLSALTTEALLAVDEGLLTLVAAAVVAPVSRRTPPEATPSAAATASEATASAAAPLIEAPLGCERRALDRHTARTRHVRRLIALLALDDIELHLFSVTDTANHFRRVVLHDRRLMDKDILSVAIVAGYETVAILHVKPLNGSLDSLRDDFLWRLFFAVSLSYF